MNSPLSNHGGRMSDARARFGGTEADWLDLSTGINPRAWTPAKGFAIDWRALPDPAEVAQASLPAPSAGDGSIMIVVATDAAISSSSATRWVE